MSPTVLVRYGLISEVARFVSGPDLALDRGERVVIRSCRGVEIGTLLEDVQGKRGGKSAPPSVQTIAEASVEGVDADGALDSRILRAATDEDKRTAAGLTYDCEREFAAWRERIDEWKLQLELIDLEWTLDKSKLILYVLNDRGPECTKLALQVAAAGLGTVEVQPIGPEGPVSPSREGGCGSGSCNSSGNSCCG